jgi:hypothetical protein
MGCINRKPEAPEGSPPKEEQKELPSEEVIPDADELIRRTEENFKLGPLKSEQIAANVRYFSIESINATQLHQAFVKCGVKRTELTDTSLLVQYNEEYNCSVERKFSSEKLISLGILLTNDSLSNKVKTLYELCDLDASKTISREEMCNIVTLILNIALEEIPKFALSKLSDNNKHKLHRTMSIYKKVKKPLNEFFLQLTMDQQDELNEEQFMKTFLKTNAKLLTDSKALRDFALKTYEYQREHDLIMTHLNVQSEKIIKVAAKQRTEDGLRPNH